ncbi:MAG: hypothetical protein ACRD1K_09615 [Acidimicrobiales bacterium]
MKNAARFLLSEPPDQLAQLGALLVDRQDELALAAEQVEAVLADRLDRPLALVGLARVGKSHLLGTLAGRLAGRFDAVVNLRVSTGLSDGRDIHRAMLLQTHSAITLAALEAGLGGGGGQWPLAPLDAVMATYGEAIDGTATELDVQQTRETTVRLQSARSLTAGLPAVLSLLGMGSLGGTRERHQESGSSAGRTVSVRPFGESVLAELVGMAHALVAEAKPSWRTLMVVDDFDLMRRADDGSFQPDRLVQSLAMLAGIPGLHVLTTVRDDTYRRHGKAFHLLALVKPFADDTLLVEVYRRHVELFYDDEDPFGSEFVGEAARRSEGRIGVFLDILRDAFTLVPATRRHTLHLADWVRGEWAELAGAEPGLAAHIVGAAQRSGGIIEHDAYALLRGTSLMRWILEDYTSESAARVHPVLLSLLREGTE